MNTDRSLDKPLKIENVESHDVRYFAMLNNAVAIQDIKQLEGGTAGEALAYYNYLFNLQIPECEIDFKLSNHQQQAIHTRMTALIKMNELLEQIFSEQSLSTKERLDKVINQIEINCAKDNVAYLPSGYKNKDGGHFAGLKARKLDNGHYAFSCLNQGEGAQFHKQLSKSADKLKYSYQSEEYEIDLQTEEGREFLQFMLELRFDPQRESKKSRYVNDYSSTDLYGLLNIYGKQITNTENIHIKSVTSQRTGTCPITNTHAIGKDILIDTDAEFNELKYYSFVMKLRSLIVGFNEYCKDPNGKYSAKIIEWALNEFSVRINKSYRNLLSDKEIEYCAKLERSYRDRLKKDEANTIKEKCSEKYFPNVIGEAPFYQENLFDKSKLELEKKEKKEIDEEIIEKPLLKEKITPEGIKNLLSLDDKAKVLPLKKVYDLFNLLPHCSGNDKDGFWDKVPEEDIKIIISNLYKIIYKLSDFSKPPASNEQRARVFAISLIAYDIVAQLLPRDSDFKLGNTYTLGLDDIYSEQKFFSDPIAYYTVKRVAKNFEKRQENAQRIFTNAVLYDDHKYDKTVNYLINVKLNEEQRNVIREALKKQNYGLKDDFTDEDLFGYLIKNPQMKDENGKVLLEQSVLELMSISGIAHAVGKFIKGYQQVDKIYQFDESEFHQHLKRISKTKDRWNIPDSYKHLPTIAPVEGSENYKDYSENTIFHPRNNLLKAREEAKGRPSYSVNTSPYQPNLSGSLNPASSVWKPEKHQQFLYEEINEDLRRIECAPNYQVNMTFDYAINNLDRLRNKDVRVRITELLFAYGKLDSAFANQSEITLMNLQRLLYALLKYCREEASDDDELIIWSASLANDLRYYLEVAAKLYNLPINQIKLASFKTFLLEAIKEKTDVKTRARFAAEVIRTYRNSLPLSIEDCCLLLLCRVISNLGSEIKIDDEVWNSLRDEVFSIIGNNKNAAEKQLTILLSEYKLITGKDWQLEGGKFYSPNLDYIIDVKSGAIQLKDDKKIQKDCTAKAIERNSELFASLNITAENTKLFYTDDDSYLIRSLDGKWEFSYHPYNDSFRIKEVKQILTINGIKTPFTLILKDHKNLFTKNPFESPCYAGSHYQYWQSIEDNDLLFVRHAEENIAYTYSKECDLILISPDDEDDFDLEKFREVSIRNNCNPILIKFEDKFMLYACFESNWSLVELKLENETLIKEIKKLKFPRRISESLSFFQTKLKEEEQKNINPENSEERIQKIESVQSLIDYEKERVKKKKDNLNKKKIFFESEIIKSGSIKEKLRDLISAYHRPIKSTAINELALNENEWVPSACVLLNLVKPQTAFEREWANRLGQIIGTTNIRCIARLSDNKQQLCLERIEHLVLGLNFTINKQQQLLCDQYPNYQLSETQSLDVFLGNSHIIILENINNSSDKKYLIPAFELNQGEKNNAFNFDDIVNTEVLCNKSQAYYSFTLNNQNELESNSVEANLYLSIMYRSLGDFKRAMHYLDQCKKHENIESEIGNIAMQLEKRKIRSPMAASFDLKLACYLIEHQKKWSKDRNKNLYESSENWKKHVAQQFEFYKKTVSGFKENIAIIPSYLRLSDEEISLLTSNQKEIKINEIVNTCSPFEDGKRFSMASKLSDVILRNSESGWKSYVNNNYKTRLKDLESDKTFSDKIPAELVSMRIYTKHNDTILFCLLKNFRFLFMEALSTNKESINQLNKMLFLLLQNDSNADDKLVALISLLIHSRDYPGYFQDFKIPEDDAELITNIGKIFCAHSDELKDKNSYLINRESNPYLLNSEIPLPSDFVSQKVQFAIDPIQYQKDCYHPLGQFAQKYFTKEEKPIATTDFALPAAGLQNASPIAKRILERLESGHEQNKMKMRAVYKVKEDTKLSDLELELKNTKAQDEKKIRKLEKILIKLANLTPLDIYDSDLSAKAMAYNLVQARASGQKYEITMSDLFTAFLQKNPSLLTEKNPFLDQKTIQTLFSQLADYALLQSRIDQTTQALKIIENKTDFKQIKPYQQQLLPSLLDKTRQAYDLHQYPEFLVYEYASHKLLRKDQVEILINLISLIESETAMEDEKLHALLQFAAGGGKTSILIPILAERFAQRGFLPVIINTSELYDIGLEDIPKNLRASFKKHIEVLERELDHKWTETELVKLLADLELWRKQGRCLLIKAVSWHSINITKKSAYFNADLRLAKAAENVLDFFKTKAVKLEDECHLVSDPLQQSIKTEGKLRKIPRQHSNLLLTCYDYLMGRKSQHIAKLAGIKNNRKRSITPEELGELKIKFAEVLVKEEVFKTISPNDLYQYLIQEEKTRPLWLESLHNNTKQDKEIADLIVLARSFIQSHLPHILTKQYLKDFGASINEGDLTAAPKHEGNDVYSHFGDHTLVAALTIQLYEECGLLPEQVDQLIDQLMKEHKKERLWNYDFSKPTKAEAWLKNIIPTFNSFRTLSLREKNNLRTDVKLTYNSAAIKKYLLHYVFPQIGVPESRITSTPAELQAGFNRSIQFSATPGLEEIYAAFLMKCFLEEEFDAQVVDTLLKEQNNRAPCFLEKPQESGQFTPEDFFKQFSPELLAKMTTLLDRGSLLTHFKVEEFIKSYLALDKKAIPTQTAAFFSNTQTNYKETMFLETKDPNVKRREDIPGAALVEALEKQGLNPEEFLLFLFLDLRKTTGTNITRPDNDHAGLTVGKEQTLTQSIQTAMRERKLLDDDAQTFTWIMFKSLYREISKVNRKENVNASNKEMSKDTQMPIVFDPKLLLYWKIENEARETETKIVTAAYQGISQAIKGLVWKKIEANPSLFKEYEKALEETQELSPYQIYEVPSRKDDCEIVLRKNVERLLEKFNLKDNDVPKEVNRFINLIIKRTSRLILELDDPPKTPLSIEVQQEMRHTEETEEETEEQQQRITNRNDSLSDFVFAVETYNSEDNLTVIFDQTSEEAKSAHYQILRMPECEDMKVPPLLFSLNHFAVTDEKIVVVNEQAKIQQLKPITNLLIKIGSNGSMQFIACTQAGVEFFSDQISKNAGTEKYPAYAIISIKGSIYSRSQNITLEDMNELIASDKCQKMMTYADFLNGEITNPIIFSQMIKELGWDKDQYERMANAIANVSVSQHPITLLNDEVLYRFCGWSDEETDLPIENYVYHQKPGLRKEIDNTCLEEQQILRPIKELDNFMETTSPPKMQPAQALSDDLLGKMLIPVDKNTFTDSLSAKVNVSAVKCI